jgi:hypothetical protein
LLRPLGNVYYYSFHNHIPVPFPYHFPLPSFEYQFYVPLFAGNVPGDKVSAVNIMKEDSDIDNELKEIILNGL